MRGSSLKLIHVTIILSIAINLSFSSESERDEFQPDADQTYQEEYMEESPPSERPTGILSKFDNLVHWAMKEEQIFHLAKVRHQRLMFEVDILKE
jgi:hypothetical protein